MRKTKEVLVGALLILTAALGAAFGDGGIQPIVTPTQVLFGSPQKTITSTAAVTISTITGQFSAAKGIATSTLTFVDGTILASSKTLTTTAAWGGITGTLSAQADLQTALNAIGTSSAAIAASTGTLAVSTTSLQVQLNGLATTYLTLSSAPVTYLTQSSATANYLQQSSAAATYLQAASLSATQPILYNSVTKIFSATPISLSTGVTGTLPAANMVSTVAFTTSSQTYSGQNIWTTPSQSTFTFGLTAGSMTVNNLAASQFVTTGAGGILTTTNLYASSPTWTGVHTFSSTNTITFTGTVAASTVQVAGLANKIVGTDAFGNLTSTNPFVNVDLASQVTGNLATSHLNSGTSASATTFWRGDGSWGTPAGGGASSLAISSGSATSSVIISSPTGNLVVDSNTINVALQGTTSSYMTLRPSSVTLQGNMFNGASQLVKLSAGTQLPAVDGNLLTNLNIANSGGILNQSVLQSGATFYVSSGTVTTFNTSTPTVTTGLFLNYGTSGCIPRLSNSGGSKLLLCDDKQTAYFDVAGLQNEIALGGSAHNGGPGFVITQLGWTNVFSADRQGQSASYFTFYHNSTLEGRFGIENDGGNWTFRDKSGNSLMLMDTLTDQTTFAYGITAGSATFVNSKPNGKWMATFSTSTVGPFAVAISTTNHLNFQDQQSSPVISGCGTQPSFFGSDNAVTITPGAGASGCTMTFAQPAKVNTPVCHVTQQTGSLVNALSYTTSLTGVVVTETSLTSKLDITCQFRDP